MAVEQLSFLDAGEDAPPDQPARQLIRDDTAATLFVEAGAGAGKTSALVGRILTLVDEGIEIGAIAAITFTEKAAAELRQRLRTELGAAPVDGHRRAALDDLDHAPIGTLHAFARRILFEFPVDAGLPPGFTVLDDLESQLALDERWEDLLDELLDDADHEVMPGLSAAQLVQLVQWGSFGGSRGLRTVSDDFQANWDLVEPRVDFEPPARPGPPEAALQRLGLLLATPVPADDAQAGLLGRVGALTAHVSETTDVGPVLGALEEIRDRLARTARTGNQDNWRDHGGRGALAAIRAEESVVSGVVEAHLAEWRRYRQAVVGVVCGRFVLAGARERAAAGTLEFHDLLVLARRLLATNESVRHRLHERYRRLLLDEFQDTDPIQLEIAVRLTAAPDRQPRHDISSLRPLPGRLFVVGDPKQSIYRFRRADIATYLAAAGQLGAITATLSANFRSTNAVIDWVNGVFGEVIRPEGRVQPAYGALDACRPRPRDHGTVRALGPDVHDDDGIDADELRRREAASVAAAIAAALRDGWPVEDDGALRPCRPGDIAVLLPARTSLPMLELALGALAVPYRAENATVVYVAPEIRDLLLALRAAADPTDALALVATLRSALYGCSDVELLAWRRADGAFDIFADAPAGLEDHGVARALAHLASISRAVGTASPSDLLDRLVVERRVLETALAGPDRRDVWRRVRYVVDQARAWTDAGGRGVRRYLRWARYQAEEGRASDTILPERDHDAVRVMTIHSAKGLEFPITVVTGMTTEVRRSYGASVAWFDGTWALAEKGNELFEEYRPLDELMSDAERRRLLYVACTRAVDHLVISLHRKPLRRDGDLTKAPSAHVLHEHGALAHGATVLDVDASPFTVATGETLELPWTDPEEWRGELARAMAVGGVRSATSATGLALALDAPGADDLSGARLRATERHVDTDVDRDPGLAKDGVDLDLPPWQRGRYGTAVGRAVHAVLQDADLATGADIAVLSEAQCAAEGIFGLERRVASLCRSALSAPIVAAAAKGAEHWRELFVVSELGGRVLEGYIDLLVRTPEGLVVVDYKTDQWPRNGSRHDARLGRYRRQLAAYGRVLGDLLGETIAAGLIVRCRSDGPADQLEVPEWSDAMREIGSAMALP